MSIKAEHLTYKYGDGTAFEQYALKDVNFRMRMHGSLAAIWLKKQPEMICLWRSASV